MEDRRLILAGIAALIATPAFAQAQQGAGAALTDEDNQYIKRMMPIGSLALATSRVAVQKASDANVKEFARFEVAEQETVADVLKSIQNPGTPNGEVRPPSDADVRQNLDQQAQASLQKLQSAQSGTDFDREYLRTQMDGHTALLKIQEDYLKSGKNPSLINTAKLARGMIKEHLQLLADIQNKPDLTTGAGSQRR
jgi:predicted outer membrane protein